MARQIELVDPRSLPTFSQSGLDAAVAKIQLKVTEFRDRLAEFLTVLRDAASKYAASAWAEINAAIDDLLGLGHKMVATVADLAQGARSPMAMYHDAVEWQGIRHTALDLGDSLEPANLNSDAQWIGLAYTSVWTGRAADAYNSTVPYQQRAALRIASIADQTAASMLTCAAAGLTFYGGLATLMVDGVAMVVKFIANLRSNPLQALNAAKDLLARLRGMLQGLGTLALQLGQAVNAQAAHVAALMAVTQTKNDFPNGTWPDHTGQSKWPKLIDGRVQVGLL